MRTFRLIRMYGLPLAGIKANEGAAMLVKGLILFLSSAAGMTSLICAVLAILKRKRQKREAVYHRVTIVLESGLSRSVTITEAELGRLLGTD